MPLVRTRRHHLLRGVVNCLLSLAIVMTVAWPEAAFAKQRKHHKRHRARRVDLSTLTIPADGSSVSVGTPGWGKLVRGVELAESDFVRYPYRSSDKHFGTEELVGLLERSARKVGDTHQPVAKMTVGDLSAEGGGRLRPHLSHRVGRDVDIGFYLLRPNGQPAASPFVRIGPNGQSRDKRRDVTFDDARNFTLIEALLMDPEARVQYIFVAPWLRARLQREGERRGASEDLMRRIDAVVGPPSRGSPHRDHFHVRIFCPVNDRPACLDEPPYHPWVFPEGNPSRPRSRSVVGPEAVATPAPVVAD